MFKAIKEIRDTVVILKSIDRKLNAILVYLHTKEKENRSVLKKMETKND